MNTFFKIIMAIAMLATFTYAHAGAAPESASFEVLSKSPTIYEDPKLDELTLMTWCTFVSVGSASTMVTERGASGFTQVTYSTSGWDMNNPFRISPPEDTDSHDAVCLNIMEVVIFNTIVPYDDIYYATDDVLRIIRRLKPDEKWFPWITRKGSSMKVYVFTYLRR